MNRLIHFLTLFTSAGTLVCCALPALLVSLGLGAVMAGLASQIPGLIWISENKVIVFIFAGSFLVLNGFWIFFERNRSCPVDPLLRQACITGRKTSRVIYLISLAVFAVGLFFAYVAPLM